MEYKEYFFTIDEKDSDMAELSLYEAGIISYSEEEVISDGKKQILFRIFPENGEGSFVSELSGRLQENGVKTSGIKNDKLDDSYLDSWKKYYHGGRAGNFDIIPAWEFDGGKTKENEIVIDPGRSFGTGTHETTSLAIEALEKYIKPGDKACDIGFGSGILSIAALKMGAGLVRGTDIEDMALLSARQNFALNGLTFPEKDYLLGDIISDRECFERLSPGENDLVMANLLTDIILEMKERLYELLRPGGKLITSGIIDERAGGLFEEMEEIGFKEIKRINSGEWVSFVFAK
jgi:ribosomal protein L11 methyltransferase